MSALLDLPAGTVYVPVPAGGTTPLPVRPAAQRVRIVRCAGHGFGTCDRPWLVGTPDLARDFQSFEDARLFVVALLDGKA